MRETPLEITAIEVEGFKSIRQRQRLEVKPRLSRVIRRGCGNHALRMPAGRRRRLVQPFAGS